MRPSSSLISRRGKCSCGKPITGDGECAECKKKREARLSTANQLFGYNFNNLSLHAAAQKRAILTDSGEENISETNGDGITRKADANTRLSPVEMPGPEPAQQATPSCSYSIGYNNIKKPGCGPGDCGASIVYDVTSVSAAGGACPAQLDGLRVTESVTTDNGCGPGTVDTGGGCPIEAGGKVRAGCTDTYSMCGPAAAFPAAGCTEKYTQKLFVGGVLAETRTITYQINKPKGGGCSGSVNRT